MSIEELKEMALDLQSKREVKKRLEIQLENLNAEMKDLEEVRMSAAMEDLGLSRVVVDDLDISRSITFRGSVFKTCDKEKFQYLLDTDNEGALKQQAIVDLANFPDVATVLEASDVDYEICYTIHHMTLSSILKELVMAGSLSTEDFEKYKVFTQPKIAIKLVKQDKTGQKGETTNG